MPNTGKSLNTHVSWNRLSEILGISSFDPVLPTSTACPLCLTGEMSVLDDPAEEGLWFHCPDCGSQGDMIELAAKVWKLSLPAAIGKLVRNHFYLPHEEEDIRQYLHNYPMRRAEIEQLWRDAKNTKFSESGDPIRALFSQLELDCELSDRFWKEGPGRLFGGIDTASVEWCFAPGSMAHARQRNRTTNPSANAVFRGAGWTNVVVVPYYDLPWRLCGFFFFRGNGMARENRVFKWVSRGFRGNQVSHDYIEAGLSLQPEILDAADRWGRTVVATHDPLMAMRLQTRNLLIVPRPLPLVVWRGGGWAAWLWQTA